jgi:hypothetical protein
VDVITNPANYDGGGACPMRRRMTTAMGTQKWLDLKQHADAASCVEGLKRDGWTVLATDLGEGAVPLTHLDLASMGMATTSAPRVRARTCRAPPTAVAYDVQL